MSPPRAVRAGAVSTFHALRDCQEMGGERRRARPESHPGAPKPMAPATMKAGGGECVAMRGLRAGCRRWLRFLAGACAADRARSARWRPGGSHARRAAGCAAQPCSAQW